MVRATEWVGHPTCAWAQPREPAGQGIGHGPDRTQGGNGLPHSDGDVSGDDADGLEHLLLRLAVGFVNVPSDGLDTAIDHALAEVGRFGGVSRAYLFRYDHVRRTVSNTHEWCAPGIEPAIDREQDVPYGAIPAQLEAHLANQPWHVPDVAALPPDAPWRNRLEGQGIGTLVTVPLWDHGELIGFAGFDIIGEPHGWYDRDLQLLQVLGELLANVEYRRRQAHAQRTIDSLSVTNQELQRFAGTVSHDLRGPLATARGFVALVRDAEAGAHDAAQLLDRAVTRIDRTIDLVDGLLSHARSGRVVGEAEAVDLGRVVDEVRDHLGARIAARQARVEHGRLPTVQGDRERLVSVFQNLVANALVHVPDDRRPEVDITATPVIDGQVDILVRDNGDGIPPDRREVALETFERGEEAQGRPGAGLGLPICRRIVAAHGGVLRLGAAPGGGLEVMVRLPASA